MPPSQEHTRYMTCKVTDENGRELWTTGDFARAYGCTRTLVRTFDELLQPIRIGRRRYYLRAEAEAFIRARFERLARVHEAKAQRLAARAAQAASSNP